MYINYLPQASVVALLPDGRSALRACRPGPPATPGAYVQPWVDDYDAYTACYTAAADGKGAWRACLLRMCCMHAGLCQQQGVVDCVGLLRL